MKNLLIILAFSIITGVVFLGCHDKSVATQSYKNDTMMLGTESVLRLISEHRTTSQFWYVAQELTNSTIYYGSSRAVPLMLYVAMTYDSAEYTTEAKRAAIAYTFVALEELKAKYASPSVKLFQKRIVDEFNRQNPAKRFNPEYIPNLYGKINWGAGFNKMDSLRLDAMFGDMYALGGLEDSLRNRAQLGEAAVYYYCAAIARNEPSLCFDAAKILYDESKRNPPALTGAVNMLRNGARMGDKKCVMRLQMFESISK